MADQKFDRRGRLIGDDTIRQSIVLPAATALRVNRYSGARAHDLPDYYLMPRAEAMRELVQLGLALQVAMANGWVLVRWAEICPEGSLEGVLPVGTVQAVLDRWDQDRWGELMGVELDADEGEESA